MKRGICLGLLLGACSVIGFACNLQQTSVEDQEHFVSSIVHEQYVSLTRVPEGKSSASPAKKLEKSLRQMPGWSDDPFLLGSWLIAEWARVRNPRVLLSHLTSLADGHAMSLTLQTSIDRWGDVLREWSASGDGIASSDSLFELGRRQYFYAKGFHKIGRGFDAAPLYLWTIVDLTRFVNGSPQDPRVAEALFLLGDSYLALRLALPADVRSDRILNLCAESCRNVIWADQSFLRWKEVMGNDV